MAIVTIKASKATPGKALDYITDKGKAAFVSCLHLDPSYTPTKISPRITQKFYFV